MKYFVSMSPLKIYATQLDNSPHSKVGRNFECHRGPIHLSLHLEKFHNTIRLHGPLYSCVMCVYISVCVCVCVR